MSCCCTLPALKTGGYTSRGAALTCVALANPANPATEAYRATNTW